MGGIVDQDQAVHRVAGLPRRRRAWPHQSPKRTRLGYYNRAGAQSFIERQQAARVVLRASDDWEDSQVSSGNG